MDTPSRLIVVPNDGFELEEAASLDYYYISEGKELIQLDIREVVELSRRATRISMPFYVTQDSRSATDFYDQILDVNTQVKLLLNAEILMPSHFSTLQKITDALRKRDAVVSAYAGDDLYDDTANLFLLAQRRHTLNDKKIIWSVQEEVANGLKSLESFDEILGEKVEEEWRDFVPEYADFKLSGIKKLLIDSASPNQVPFLRKYLEKFGIYEAIQFSGETLGAYGIAQAFRSIFELAAEFSRNTGLVLNLEAPKTSLDRFFSE